MRGASSELDSPPPDNIVRTPVNLTIKERNRFKQLHALYLQATLQSLSARELEACTDSEFVNDRMKDAMKTAYNAAEVIKQLIKIDDDRVNFAEAGTDPVKRAEETADQMYATVSPSSSLQEERQRVGQQE
jgi:ribonuclease HII